MSKDICDASMPEDKKTELKPTINTIAQVNLTEKCQDEKQPVSATTKHMIGLDIPICDIRNENWRSVMVALKEKFTKKRDIYNEAATYYYKLDIFLHFIPLMLIQASVAVMSAVSQSVKISEIELREINIAILIVSSVATVYTCLHMRLSWTSKRVQCKHCAERYDFLINEVKYRQLVFKESCDQSAFYKWLYETEREIRNDFDLVPAWLMRRLSKKLKKRGKIPPGHSTESAKGDIEEMEIKALI